MIQMKRLSNRLANMSCNYLKSYDRSFGLQPNGLTKRERILSILRAGTPKLQIEALVNITLSKFFNFGGIDTFNTTQKHITKRVVTLIHNIFVYFISNRMVMRLMRKPRHRAILFRVKWERPERKGGGHAM